MGNYIVQSFRERLSKTKKTLPRASEFPALFYLYDDLIDALRHFARAYNDTMRRGRPTAATFPSKMIVAHLMIRFGEEIAAEPKADLSDPSASALPT